MSLAFVAAGGALGALCRYGVQFLFLSHSLPWATLLVNIIGSLIGGIAMGRASLLPGSPLYLLLVTGFLGAFTTFSAFSTETLRLWQGPGPLWALANVAGNIFLCLAAVTAGFYFAQ